MAGDVDARQRVANMVDACIYYYEIESVGYGVVAIGELNKSCFDAAAVSRFVLCRRGGAP